MSKVKHVLGLSGGKDSAALALYMRQEHPEIDIDYFFTDTGEELPEVYEYLTMMEGALGKRITRLNSERNFEHWLRATGHFLPSAMARWCTIKMKLMPFKGWVNQFLKDGYTVYSYVAIRADEEYRQGYVSEDKNLIVKLPFREDGIDKEGVLEILSASGLGLPKYYEWRSRSGCTFCFFQQKIEWVRLKERHPEAFERAKMLEKEATEKSGGFTWNQKESLAELEQPERIKQIKEDYEERLKRAENYAKKYQNALRVDIVDIDDVYGLDEGEATCNVCHK